MVNPVAPVSGSRQLAHGFAHPHASDQARQIAENGMILRTQVGSGVHGTALAGQDDRDEMGICLEPPQFITGLARVPHGINGDGPSVSFEQYQRHTVAGAELVAHADRFVSRQAAQRFLGYLQAQKAAMTAEVGAHTNRPELVAVHGYDTKYAMHALRLGIQGVELLTTGRITLPMPQPDRDYLRTVRRGEVTLAEVVDRVDDTEAQLVRLRDGASVPNEPDRAWVDGWLHRSYTHFWTRSTG